MIAHSSNGNKAHFHFLVEKIKALWEAGVSVDESVATYIASTFSNPSIDHLKQVISNRSNVERDSLVDLLLYPDEAFQVALEPLVQNQPIAMPYGQKVVDWLNRCRISIMIYFPSLAGNITIQPSRPELERAISRLNLDWKFPQALYRVINHYIEKNRRVLLMVRLRNAGLKMNDVRTRFLCDLIKTFPDLTGRFADYFHFAITFLSAEPGKPIVEALMAEKKRFKRGLRQSIQFEAAWPKANMETLMLRGVHAPADSAAFYRSRIALIDDLVWSMYGKGKVAEADLLDY